MGLRADASQLRQVFLNLLLNACDALTDGGRIIVNVSRSRPPAELDESPISWVPKWVLISIRDSGPGLSAEILDHIFEPFRSTKETGTGLGLLICHRIVEAHGGRISVANSMEGGAVFWIHLPSHRGH